MQAEVKRRPERRLWLILLLILLLLAAAAVAYAMKNRGGSDGGGSGRTPSHASEEAAAQAGLATLKRLAGTPMIRSLGFRSAEEAARAQLARPFAVQMIRLDALKGLRPGIAPETLLTPLPQSVYPVTVDGRVRSSLTVARGDGGYSATSFGDAALIVPAAVARDRGSGEFLVRVPALGLQFVGGRSGEGLTLAPTASDPRLQLEAGRPIPAEVVLRQLVPLAKAYNGLPM